MVLLLAITGVLGWRALTAQPKVPQVPCNTQTVSSVNVSDIAVNIYNYQGGTVGLASSLKTQLVTAGFTSDYIFVGNLPVKQDVPASTTIIGGKADAPEVTLVAGFFPGSVIQADGRTDHSVDVLIGATWGGFDASFDATAAPSVDANNATICPPIITPSGTPTDSGSPADTSTDTPTDQPT